MCGIVGYVGPRDAEPVVLDGLERLEYRGYDSAGIVAADAGRLTAVKRAGKLAVLADALRERPLSGRRAIGHTRWATHGRPTDANAHPHLNEDGTLAVVHNGIIENHRALRERLEAAGHVFRSETDTEVLVHLIEDHLRRAAPSETATGAAPPARAEDVGALHAAVRAALAEVKGAYALVVLDAERDEIVAARMTSPLVIGHGEGETFVASDVPALLPYTRSVTYLEDGEIATITADGVQLRDLTGEERPLRSATVEWDAEAAEKGGWPHFMLKEIYEQPAVLRATVAGRIVPTGDDVELDLQLDPQAIDRVVIVAAGTASYAGLVGETLIERLARIPAEVEVASEFRYRQPVVGPGTLIIAVSQSGETIDTLEAVREARRHGAATMGILNVKGSSIARDVDDVVYIHAGPEIGVASTKAYTAMIAAFALLAVRLGRARGTLAADDATSLLAQLRAMPDVLETALTRRDAVREVALSLTSARSVLYLGRGPNVASAYEGALKLKEISYLHAEAYPTGEMKHGPIALIDDVTPTVALAPLDALHAKTLSSLQEVRARDGRVIALANDGDDAIATVADAVLRVPTVHELLTPIALAVPMQLLAYETAVALGRDVDQPRNLAKSVTVE